MSKFSNYTENNIIETTLRGAAYPVPASINLAPVGNPNRTAMVPQA